MLSYLQHPERRKNRVKFLFPVGEKGNPASDGDIVDSNDAADLLSMRWNPSLDPAVFLLFFNSKGRSLFFCLAGSFPVCLDSTVAPYGPSLPSLVKFAGSPKLRKGKNNWYANGLTDLQDLKERRQRYGTGPRFRYTSNDSCAGVG